MNAIKKIKSVFATGLVLLLVSCNSWLEVDPEDRIMDNTLFKDKEGFMTATKWRVFGIEQDVFVRS